MHYSQKNPESIKTLFNQVAKNYDKLNVLMSFGLQKLIKQKAVSNIASKIKSDKIKILDLCCGTGDISVLLKKIFPNSEITSIDFSNEMLAIAKNRIKDITFIEADVTNLDGIIEKDNFDICFIGFGLRNLPDIDNFLLNIKQYLKSNGILSILDLGQPKWYMKPYFFLHYELFIPFFASIINKKIKPYKYFINSAKTYPNQEEILKKLEKYGYKNLENKNFSFGIISQQIGIKG